jgi:hypothetical protein
MAMTNEARYTPREAMIELLQHGCNAHVSGRYLFAEDSGDTQSFLIDADGLVSQLDVLEWLGFDDVREFYASWQQHVMMERSR